MPRREASAAAISVINGSGIGTSSPPGILPAAHRRARLPSCAVSAGATTSYTIVVSWTDRRTDRAYSATGNSESFSYTATVAAGPYKVELTAEEGDVKLVLGEQLRG